MNKLSVSPTDNSHCTYFTSSILFEISICKKIYLTCNVKDIVSRRKSFNRIYQKFLNFFDPAFKYREEDTKGRTYFGEQTFQIFPSTILSIVFGTMFEQHPNKRAKLFESSPFQTSNGRDDRDVGLRNGTFERTLHSGRINLHTHIQSLVRIRGSHAFGREQARRSVHLLAWALVESRRTASKTNNQAYLPRRIADVP